MVVIESSQLQRDGRGHGATSVMAAPRTLSQAKLEREKLERRAARKANMAAKRAKAKSQMAFVNANGLETPSVDREV